MKRENLQASIRDKNGGGIEEKKNVTSGGFVFYIYIIF